MPTRRSEPFARESRPGFRAPARPAPRPRTAPAADRWTSSNRASRPATWTSAWPDRLLIALENSLKAAALIRWIAKPMATPTAIAVTASTARTGWARHSPTSSQRDSRFRPDIAPPAPPPAVLPSGAPLPPSPCLRAPRPRPPICSAGAGARISGARLAAARAARSLSLSSRVSRAARSFCNRRQARLVLLELRGRGAGVGRRRQRQGASPCRPRKAARHS